MNQRRYIEHNLFLQSSNTKHINQVLHKPYSSLAQVLLRSCESSYQNILHNILHNISLKSCSGLVKVLTKISHSTSHSTSYTIPYTIPYSSLTQVLLKSCESSNMTPYSGLVKPLPKISHLVISMNLVTHFFIHK